MRPRLEAEEAANHERPTGMNINTPTKCSQVTLVVKNPVVNAGNIRDAGSIPESERSPRGGCGDPFQFLPRESHAQTSLPGTVHEVIKSQT